MEPRDKRNTLNYLVMGPWRHSQVNYDGSALGALNFEGDTARQFRSEVLRPFLDQYLVDGAPKADTPPVFIYNTGENHWDRLKAWPRSCDKGCASSNRPLYLQAGGKLSFQQPVAGQAGFEEYVSDPPSRCRSCRARWILPTARCGPPGWCTTSALSMAALTC